MLGSSHANSVPHSTDPIMKCITQPTAGGAPSMSLIILIGFSSGITPIIVFMSMSAERTTVATKPATIPFSQLPEVIGSPPLVRRR
jgi:hypothetical protein